MQKEKRMNFSKRCQLVASIIPLFRFPFSVYEAAPCFLNVKFSDLDLRLDISARRARREKIKAFL